MADTTAQDWPHDPDGEKGSEGMRNFDMAVLSKMVEEDEFPLQKAEFVEEFGDWPVRINHKTVVSVADIFEDVEEESFENKVEFHRSVGRAIRKTGLWEYMPDAEPA
ncbi:MAG: DUF5785 family protein [Halobacteriota archaeon]|uniref:DUF5785 family protein n=1 Tax=Halanaeroarchaeum sp. HSR-CO TaxID=2866382 RepID=UPI00217DBC23|nr:DUF5785 family protein [Halanaeroarchaeum sp. HSR-CO]UWG48328.1 Uncharacterized protein HSRCO_2055 [Halanaeroarchaeum sp. HSR-CO]